MKNYTTNYDRDKIVKYLLLLSLVLSFSFNKYFFPYIFEPILDIVKKTDADLYNLLLNIDWLLKTLEYTAFYQILYSLYDKKLWKTKIFNRFNLCMIPNINGKWFGESVSSRKNDDGMLITRCMEMEIVQSFTKIKVTCCFFADDERSNQTSVSYNDVSGLYFDEASVTLKFVFKNRSKEVHTESKNYMGYNEFEINTALDEMDGDYFTGRDSGQHNGKMKLKRVLTDGH